jgi:hypothetical protein
MHQLSHLFSITQIFASSIGLTPADRLTSCFFINLVASCGFFTSPFRAGVVKAGASVWTARRRASFPAPFARPRTLASSRLLKRRPSGGADYSRRQQAESGETRNLCVAHPPPGGVRHKGEKEEVAPAGVAGQIAVVAASLSRHMAALGRLYARSTWRRAGSSR